MEKGKQIHFKVYENATNFYTNTLIFLISMPSFFFRYEFGKFTHFFKQNVKSPCKILIEIKLKYVSGDTRDSHSYINLLLCFRLNALSDQAKRLSHSLQLDKHENCYQSELRESSRFVWTASNAV